MLTNPYLYNNIGEVRLRKPVEYLIDIQHFKKIIISVEVPGVSLGSNGKQVRCKSGAAPLL